MFQAIFNLVFCKIFNFVFHEIKNYFVKILRSGVRGGGGLVRPGASSALMQTVPYSSSLYTVFHSVIYNSVDLALESSLK